MVGLDLAATTNLSSPALAHLTLAATFRPAATSATIPDVGSEATFSAVGIAKLVAFAHDRGMDATAIARAAGISATDVGDPERRVGIAGLYAAWETVMRALRDPAVPVNVARTYRIEDLHVMGFALMSSADAREACARAIRYFALLSDSGRWELEEIGDRAIVRWWRSGELSLGHRVANEAAMAVFVHTFRQVVGEAVPVAATFRHAAPAKSGAHARFFGAGARFGDDEDSFSFAREVLDRIPRTANPALSAFFERHAESLLPHYAGVSMADRARDAIARELASGMPTMSTVARRLGASERSLRRRLAEEGVKFRDLVSDVQRVRARELLRQPDATVTDVAFLLGFSDASAFARAFKRWFGHSPKELRAYR